MNFLPWTGHQRAIGAALGAPDRVEREAERLVTLDRDACTRRLILATTIAVVAGALAYGVPRTSGPSDFAQVWAAARGWRQGLDPYTIVGPHRPFEWPFPLLYPLTAVIAGLPFSWMPLPLADACFVAVGAWVLVWALTRGSVYSPTLWAFVSLSFLYVIQTSQWSTLITASVLLPALAPLWICKPTIGAALLAAYPRRSTLIAGLVCLLASVALYPSWIREWMAGLSSAPHVAPLVRATFAGPLVLLSLVRWRRPEARLLAALVCVPQTPLLYEAIPVFLVARKHWEGIALAALTVVAWSWWVASPSASYDQLMAASGRAMVWCVYLPATLFVLRRPNVWNDEPPRVQAPVLDNAGALSAAAAPSAMTGLRLNSRTTRS